MNKKLVVFIINPKSGVERVKELKQLILSTLHLDEFDYEIWHTKYAKHGKELAKQAKEKMQQLLLPLVAMVLSMISHLVLWVLRCI